MSTLATHLADRVALPDLHGEDGFVINSEMAATTLVIGTVALGVTAFATEIATAAKDMVVAAITKMTSLIAGS